ncbi:hypothetical protein D5S17_34245 [Pseudonocardiaceae bacterium YIM PH 21723]|nr:hypothetical protein D5S17_34245 [Pseudonocardiaceae bacterium YIM PH 21723]
MSTKHKILGGTIIGAALLVLAGGIAMATDGGNLISPVADQSVDSPVSEAQAREIAQNRVPGAQITEVDRDHEDGRPVWEIELRKDRVEYEIEVNADNGQIVDYDEDHDDD